MDFFSTVKLPLQKCSMHTLYVLVNIIYAKAFVVVTSVSLKDPFIDKISKFLQAVKTGAFRNCIN